MSVYEHTGARVFGTGSHHVTVIPGAAFCTCGAFTHATNHQHSCQHLDDVRDHIAAQDTAEHHRLERLMVEHSIRVLPEIGVAA